MNSLKKDEGVPLLNLEGGPRVPLLKFKGIRVPGSQGPQVLGPRVLAPLLHHVMQKNAMQVVKTKISV